MYTAIAIKHTVTLIERTLMTKYINRTVTFGIRITGRISEDGLYYLFHWKIEERRFSRMAERAKLAETVGSWF